MEVEVNYVAILLAAVASMVVSMIYYSEKVAGNTWRKLAGVDADKQAKVMPKLIPWLFVASLLTSYIVAHVMYLSHAFYDYSWLSTGVTTALWLWLGIAATTLFVHNAPEMKPMKLTWISIGNRLVTFLAIGLVLGWLHP